MSYLHDSTHGHTVLICQSGHVTNKRAVATATDDQGECRLSRSLFPDIALGGTNAAQRTMVRLDLQISEGALLGGVTMWRGNVTDRCRPSWAASGQGVETKNDFVNGRMF
jgi:hypothetical protein